jgi:Phosphopantothenoylcysteine synthetase/decarboxylase
MAAMEKSSRRKLEKTNPRKVVDIPAGRKSVVLGVTGSIAAYKSAELASLLVKQGHEVFVVMTHDAAEFISPLTLQTLSKNPVIELLRRKGKLATGPHRAWRTARTCC